MTAAALLARLNEAGVSASVDGRDLKLTGRKSALSAEIVADIKAAKAELVAFLSSPVQGWRAQIKNAPSLPDETEHDAYRSGKMEALRADALLFIDQGWAHRAGGWSATELFGVNPAAPVRRVGAWGVVPFLSWSPLAPQITAIEDDHATLVTPLGGTLRKPRMPKDQAEPFWKLMERGDRTTWHFIVREEVTG